MREMKLYMSVLAPLVLKATCVKQIQTIVTNFHVLEIIKYVLMVSMNLLADACQDGQEIIVTRKLLMHAPIYNLAKTTLLALVLMSSTCQHTGVNANRALLGETARKLDVIVEITHA